jgi:hypothetical protein
MGRENKESRTGRAAKRHQGWALRLWKFTKRLIDRIFFAVYFPYQSKFTNLTHIGPGLCKLIGYMILSNVLQCGFSAP